MTSLLLPYLRPLFPRYAGGAVFLLLTNGFALLIPWFMKLAIEGLQYPAPDRLSPAACSLIIAALAAVHGITRIFSRTVVLNAARIIEFRIREELFNHIVRLDLKFFSENRTGDILSRFSNDLTNVRMLVGFGAMSAMNTVIIYTATITLMCRINPTLTFWAVLPFPLMVLMVKRISHSLFQRSLDAQEELARLSSMAEESVSSVRLIKSYCRELHFQELFSKLSGEYLRHNMLIARLRGLIMPVMAIATGAGALVIMFLGGRLVISGVMTLGDFVAFSGYLAMLVWPTAVMGWILTLAQRGAASMSRLGAILTADPGIADRPDAAPLKDFAAGVEFRALTFGYNDVLILNNISFTIAPGEKIGITGEVGSGKTTLLKLLLRLLKAQDGMILVNDRDINGITLESLRRIIGYVPQDAFLFSRSIRENVGYGFDGDDDAKVAEAVQRAGLNHDVEQFTAGLETIVGEKGVMLSGGQKQRLSLARALISDPRLLVLDDPLSAVDAAREEEILGELAEFYGERTVLIVSHRLSVFRNCDRVIVLKEGRIVEEGSPADLLVRDGVYASMERMQRLKRELL